MVTVYGLKNCDTCRAAMKWLASAGISATLIDLRHDGASADRLDAWLAVVGWETLLNRRSTTWRALSESERADLDEAKARALMRAHPTLIKRPVIETGNAVLVGFGDVQKTALSGG